MSKTIMTLGFAWFALSVAPQARAESSATSGKALYCVESTSEARFRAYAYDHLVTLHNQCDKAATCTVTTDVNPEPITVELSPDESKTVITFSASPARTFHASVSCKERS